MDGDDKRYAFNDKTNFSLCGKTVTGREYKVLEALMRAEEPMKVVRISGILNGEYDDLKLYESLTKLHKDNLVLKEMKIEEIKGQKFNQVYWSLTPEVRERLKNPTRKLIMSGVSGSFAKGGILPDWLRGKDKGKK